MKWFWSKEKEETKETKAKIPSAKSLRKAMIRSGEQERKDWEEKIAGKVLVIESLVAQFKNGVDSPHFVYYECTTIEERNYVATRFLREGFSINHNGSYGLHLKISW